MTATTADGQARKPHRGRTHEASAECLGDPGLATPVEHDAGMRPEMPIDQRDDAEPRLGEAPADPLPPLSDEEIVAIEARGHELREYWDRVHAGLRTDAQATARSMCVSPLLGKPSEWDDLVGRSLDDYRSGKSLMAHLGADRLIDPALTGMLLAIRRGLIEEIHSPSTADYVLIDMAVISFANAMRIQSIIGNTSLIIESEMFGQPTLRAKWKKEYFGRPEDIRGLAAEDHVVRLREQLLPLVERFHRLAEDAIAGTRRQRQMPAAEVERSVPREVRLTSVAASNEQRAIAPVPDLMLKAEMGSSRQACPVRRQIQPISDGRHKLGDQALRSSPCPATAR
jgi:hypothetical protein